MNTPQPIKPLQAQGLMPTPKPRVRVRKNLTSLQINDEQKATIDEAFTVFKQTAEIPGVTKGQFIEGLAQEFLHHVGGNTTNTQPTDN